MGRPAAESAQQGLTQRCAILGNFCDMVEGKEAQECTPRRTVSNVNTV